MKIYNIEPMQEKKIGDFNWKSDELNSCFIISKRKDDYLEGMYDYAIKQVSSFFEISPDLIKEDLILYVWKSRKTYDILSGRKSEPWEIARGFERDLGLFILDKDFYDSESNHKFNQDKFFALLKHEIIHSFFNYLSKGVARPIWLTEGVSICFSGQNKEGESPKEFFKFLDSFSSYKNPKEVYSQSGFVVMYLFQEFGKEKLISLIKSLSKVKSKEDFNGEFKKIYKEEPTYKFFNKLMEKNNEQR